MINVTIEIVRTLNVTAAIKHRLNVTAIIKGEIGTQFTGIQDTIDGNGTTILQESL